ncbi:MAG: trypsin-like peptidase domain-containing protein [Bacteroidetes bacterium]|nr:trypsin-like peptidase domain-containing protein [Bacteroidota bacterium]
MRRIIVIFLWGFFCCTINAQISTEEIPYSWGRSSEEIMKQSIPMETMPHLDMKALKQEDEKNDNSGGKPFRFGFPHDVNFDLSNSGVWQTTSDGGRLWNLRIYSPDALSLNLLYDKFWLPDGAKFFIYSEDKTQHIGAFTYKNNQGNRDSIMGFATGFLFTNSIVLEYYEPKYVENKGIISIAKIISGYRHIYNIAGKENQLRGNDPNLLPCHNDVNCAVGNNYQSEKNAVALMILGWDACTGALLNTTANDGRPVFLTANHCFVAYQNANQWIFYWNYEAPCGSVVNPAANKSTTGATILARRADTDFMLLNLIENPVTNSNISTYYLGWDRTTTPATSGVSIHHPLISQKKISITTNSINNNPTTICWDYNPNNNICEGGITHPNTHWDVVFTNGAVEDVSSGAPILNQNKRVIGQLHGSTSGSSCPPNIVSQYGRFNLSWNGGMTNTTRLSNWLDPNNTNAMFVDGCGGDINFPYSTVNLSQDFKISCGNINMQNVIVTGTNVVLTLEAGGNINVQEVQVKNGATLILKAGGKVNIIRDFKVDLGSMWRAQ